MITSDEIIVAKWKIKKALLDHHGWHKQLTNYSLRIYIKKLLLSG